MVSPGMTNESDLVLVLTSLLKILGIVFLIIPEFPTAFTRTRVSALIQDRLARTVGPAGLFSRRRRVQVHLKEDLNPANVNKFYYWLAPCLAMVRRS